MRMQRQWRILVGAVLAGLAAGGGGCSTMDNTTKGAGIGAALGSGLGLAVGAATGNPKTGAVVGGLAGAGLGGAVGNGMDREDREKREDRQTAVAVAQAQAVEAQANAQRMGVQEVVQMVQAGHEEQVIVNQIRNTRSTFLLSAGDLDYLKHNNVPPRVIIEMQNARPAPGPVVYGGRPRTVVVREPAYVYHEPPPVVFVGPPPPPVLVGGYYHH
ncbi:MAG: hypothetical protein K2X82_04435 [Gemmataceae bacterium]|nr:hypothetical protein [Gemmataceae bacterium]